MGPVAVVVCSESMRLGRLRGRWAVLRTFGAWGRIVAETPHREPVIEVEHDRLVFRRVDRQFWLAATCPRCAATTAVVDLPAHRRHCLAPASGAGGLDEGPAGTGLSRLRASGEDRSSVRAFGQGPPLPARLLFPAAALLVFIVAFLARLS